MSATRKIIAGAVVALAVAALGSFIGLDSAVAGCPAAQPNCPDTKPK